MDSMYVEVWNDDDTDGDEDDDAKVLSTISRRCNSKTHGAEHNKGFVSLARRPRPFSNETNMLKGN